MKLCSRPLCTFVPSLVFAILSLRTLGFAEQALFEVTPSFNLQSLESRAVDVSIAAWQDQHALRLVAGQANQWPGITLYPPTDVWDLSKRESIAVDVRNGGTTDVTFHLRVDSRKPNQRMQSVTSQANIKPGEQQTIRVTLQRPVPARLKGRLFGMRANPDQLGTEPGLDPDSISSVVLFFNKQSFAQQVELANLRTTGTAKDSIWSDETANPFPFIDVYGQYQHRDWPGKIHSDQDLLDRRNEEQKELESHHAPEGWNQYGGWAGGPAFPSTGRFRVQKHNDRWWLIDPTGRLFWSHGIDCVRFNNATTPITHRQFYFADLPERSSALGAFYGTVSGAAPHGYYRDVVPYQTFNFTGANLFRKYGVDWDSQSRDLCHNRLRSWGMNTIGNWSDSAVYRMNRTPYVVTSGTGGRRIEGSSGYWGKFPDPFDEEFANVARQQMRRHREAANSPWCVGVFIDNELAWGDETSLAEAALMSPADQPAKLAMLEFLKARYADIKSLNAAWQTEHESWEALLQQNQTPDKEKAGDDLRAFYTEIAEQYFKICRQAVKEVAPDTLYLGCRFAWVNDRAVRVAAEYCDVIAFNRYDYSVADFALPAGIDRPAIIGEFHFGALDRGLFHTGLKTTRSQQDRADAYRRYISGALKNPIWVGAHWFQFGDQAATGRFDGENYQIGFLDICDTPYAETIEAAREMGAAMYKIRFNGD